MASGSFGVSTSNGYISGSINWSESNVNNANNTSDVYAEMRLSRTNSGYTSYGTDTFWVNINGTQVSNTLTYSLTQNSNTLMVSGTVTVAHNSDGTKSITISWGGGGGGSGVFTVNGSSGTATLSNIARAATIPNSYSWTAGTQNLSVNISTYNSSYHYHMALQVQNPGGTWATVADRTGITGSSYTFQFTQSEITAMYNQLTQGTGVWENRPAIIYLDTYDSGNNFIGETTQTGQCNAVGTSLATIPNNSFNIGDGSSLSATINPVFTDVSGSNSFSWDVILTVGSFTKTWSNLTSQSNTLTLTTSDVNSLFSQTPNSNSVSGTLQTRTKYNGVYTEDGNPTSDVVSVTVNVVNSNPTFNGGYTYADTNGSITAITTNNQYIVQNKSNLTVTLPNSAKALPVNYAGSISYYTCSINGVSIQANNFAPTAAPTLSTANTGGSLGAGTYYVMYSWINASGESFTSPEASIVVPSGTSTNKITVTLPTFPGGVTSANIYISTTTGTETKQGNATTTTYNQTAALVSGASQPSLTFNMGTVNATVNQTLTITAVDSRGNSKAASTTVNIVPYSPPVVNTTSTRSGGFDVNTTITLNGSFSLVTIPSLGNKNSLVTVQYQYKKATDSSYGALNNFTYTTSTNTYTVPTPPVVSLDNTMAWNIKVIVTDKIGSTTTVINTVGAGQPIVFMDATKKSVGIGKFPSGTGTFETSADVLIGGATQSGIINVIGATAGWFKLGTISMPQGGHTASINLYGGSSYNALDSQIAALNITIRTGNSSATSGGGTAVSAVAYRYGGSSLAFTNVKLVQNSAGTGATAYDVIINTGVYVGAMSYEIIGTTNTTWVQANTSVSDPGAASTTVYIVPMYYKVLDPFFSAKNTLDDGSGNMSVYGSLTAKNGRNVMTSNSSAYRIELVTVTYSINGGTQFSVNGTFTSAFQTTPTVWYCRNQVVVSYTDVLMTPEISNVSTTGFSCTFRIYNGSPNNSPTFGTGSSWFDFVVMGY